VDEVCFFETITHHLYIPLEILEERAALIGKRIQALKAAGIPSVGINVLTTMGHLDEAPDFNVPMPFQPMTGPDGSVSSGCGCPNTAEARAYIRAKYALMAKQNPDFIWVDDDIRMQHHGVDYACFCPTCLALFNQQTGRQFTRETLVAALNDPACQDVREAWIEGNIRTIESLMAWVEESIHQATPEAGRIQTGLMTAGPGWTTYSGVAFERWFTALKAAKSRPGGGFYSDDQRLQIIEKALDLGYQRASLPAGVTDIQYELENFPYQPMKKSALTVKNESTLALALGLNGIAYNCLGMWDEDFADYQPIADQVTAWRPVWERLLEHAGDLPTAGLWVAWTPQLMARRRLLPGEDWFVPAKAYQFTRANILAEIGLPLCSDPSGNPTVLYGRVAEGFTDDQLRSILSGGVLMDSTALAVLETRGLGHLAGVHLARQYTNGAIERFTDDPLNGHYAGSLRDARIEFWGDARGLGDTIEPISGSVHRLAEMESYYGKGLGTCLTAYENELGGRVVVNGYAPWMFLHSKTKREQLANLADWISRDTLPVRIQQPVPLIPFVRLAADRRRGALVLLNTGLEPLQQIDIEVRTPAAGAVRISPCGTAPLTQVRQPRGWSSQLERIEPWETVVILFGKQS